MAPHARPAETFLLAGPALVGGIASVSVALAIRGAVDGDALFPVAITLAGLVGVHLILTLSGHRGDPVLLPVAGMLSIIGVVMAQRLSHEPSLQGIATTLSTRQVQWVLVGLLVLVVVQLIPNLMSPLARYRYLWLFIGFGLVLIALAFGEDLTGTGARLWIGLGPWRFQSSELLKVLLVIFLASYLDERRELLAHAWSRLGPFRLPPLPYLAPLLIVWITSLALLIAQQDLGVALLIYGICLGMLYLASGRAGYLLGGVIFFLIGAGMAILWVPRVQVRILNWLDPWTGSTGRAYQPVQALIALASGGVLGQGLGYGYPGVIPAVHTDFIFAAIGEEMGLAGALAVITLYLILVARGMRVVMEARRSFEALLASGLSLTIALQTLLIIGGTLRVIPLTGIPLPFVSYGGSSLVTNYLIVGLLLRLSGTARAQVDQ